MNEYSDKTQNQHYISQWKLRQFAYNKDAKNHRQKSYQHNRSLKPTSVNSVKIESSCSIHHLFTMGKDEKEESFYNLENQFNDYEKQHCCVQKSVISAIENSKIPQYEHLVSFISAEFLNALRNPNNIDFFLKIKPQDGINLLSGLNLYDSEFKAIDGEITNSALCAPNRGQYIGVEKEVYRKWLKFVLFMVAEKCEISPLKRFIENLLNEHHTQLSLYTYTDNDNDNDNDNRGKVFLSDRGICIWDKKKDDPLNYFRYGFSLNRDQFLIASFYEKTNPYQPPQPICEKIDNDKERLQWFNSCIIEQSSRFYFSAASSLTQNTRPSN